MTWTERAACAGKPASIFYSSGVDYSYARSICAGCPVTAECLQDAIDTGDHHGFRGGHTPDELHALIRDTGGGKVTKACAMCNEPYTVGGYATLRRYCGPACSAKATRAVKRAYNRRARAGAA